MFKYSQCSMRQKYTDEPTFLKKKLWLFCDAVRKLIFEIFYHCIQVWPQILFCSPFCNYIRQHLAKMSMDSMPTSNIGLDDFLLFIKQGSLGRGTHHHTLASLTSSHELRRGLSMVSQLQFFGQQLLTLIEYRALQAAHDQKSMLN